MKLLRYFLGALLLGAAYGTAAAQGQSQPAERLGPLPFWVGAHWFQGDYELPVPMLGLPFSTADDYAVKPWQLTVGHNVTPHLAIQLGYSYAYLNYRQNEEYVNSTGQAIRTAYHEEALIHCLPLLARYDLSPYSQSMHVSLLAGLTGITMQDDVAIETTSNGQPLSSRRIVSQATQLYATGGAGIHYPFVPHLDALFDLMVSRSFSPQAGIGGNPQGLTWVSALGLRYHFAVKKHPLIRNL